jgi:hypothetical protein
LIVWSYDGGSGEAHARGSCLAQVGLKVGGAGPGFNVSTFRVIMDGRSWFNLHYKLLRIPILFREHVAVRCCPWYGGWLLYSVQMWRVSAVFLKFLN